MASRDTGFRDYYKTKAASGYRPERNRRQPKQPSFFDRIGSAFTGGTEKAKSYLPGTVGMATRGIESVLKNRQMHNQNVNYFGGNWFDSKVPNKVKESLMTPKDKTFYDKYMRLADMASDPDKRQEHIDTANTARQNMQITGRLNYGLSQIDPQGTYTNKTGLPSYSQDLFGEGYNRFNLDRFKKAMGMGEGILGGLDPKDRHPDALDDYEKETLGLPSYMREDEGIFGNIPVTGDLPPSGRDLNPRIPPWAKKKRDMTTTDTDLATDPRPWLRDEIEDPLLGVDESNLKGYPLFDDSGREEAIMGKRRDEDHPLWAQYQNYLRDEGDSYDFIEGGPPTFEEYLGAWKGIHDLPRGLHYQEPRSGIR